MWNDGPDSAGGGGISALFPVPSYQTNVSIPPSVNPGHRLGRGVPDVSIKDNTSETGVLVASPDGSLQTVGGTSPQAPFVGRAGRAFEPDAVKPDRVFEPVPVGNAKSRSVTRHHRRQHRIVQRDSGMGCLYGLRKP